MSKSLDEFVLYIQEKKEILMTEMISRYSMSYNQINKRLQRMRRNGHIVYVCGGVVMYGPDAQEAHDGRRTSTVHADMIYKILKEYPQGISVRDITARLKVKKRAGVDQYLFALEERGILVWSDQSMIGLMEK